MGRLSSTNLYTLDSAHIRVCIAKVYTLHIVGESRLDWWLKLYESGEDGRARTYTVGTCCIFVLTIIH